MDSFLDYQIDNKSAKFKSPHLWLSSTRIRTENVDGKELDKLSFETEIGKYKIVLGGFGSRAVIIIGVLVAKLPG